MNTDFNVYPDDEELNNGLNDEYNLDHDDKFVVDDDGEEED